MKPPRRPASDRRSLALVVLALAAICGLVAWSLRDTRRATPITAPSATASSEATRTRLEPLAEAHATSPARAAPAAEPSSPGAHLHGIVRAGSTGRAEVDLVVTHVAEAGRGARPVHTWKLKSDASGRFELVGVPAGGTLSVEATARGFVPAHAEVLARSEDVILDLVAVREPFARVRGTVVSADGTPAARVSVALGTVIGATDQDGRFELAIDAPDPEADLVAATPAAEAAIQRGFGATLRSGASPEVRLVLGGPCGSISGRVVDRAGAPLANWKVAIEGPDPAGVALGREPARSNSAGEFRIGSVSPGVYALRAWDRRREAGARVDRVEAGATDVVIRAR